MKLSELLDAELLGEHVVNGYVSERPHPLDPNYLIYNYTPKAVHENLWDSVTTKTRGLIVKADSGFDWDVIARPWDKFFNYGEKAVLIDSHEPVEVTDKLDGSLGILYYGPDGWAIATRGSFDSEQARHGTKILQRKIAAGDVALSKLGGEAYTYLFEIIYPENRIVVDYNGLDDLVLLGARHNAHGYVTGPLAAACHITWNGPMAEQFEYQSLSECLGVHRPGKEGFVVRAGQRMVKLKQEDYVQLHRIVTNLTPLRVWEMCAVLSVQGNESLTTAAVAKLLKLDPAVVAAIKVADLPWLDKRVPQDLVDKMGNLAFDLTYRSRELRYAWERQAYDLAQYPRKVAAEHIKNLPDPAALFAALDGKDLRALSWLKVRPSGSEKFFTRKEEAE